MASKTQSRAREIITKKDNNEDIQEDIQEKASDLKQFDKEQLQHKIQQELYRNVLLEEYIYLKPADLNNKIDDIILQKLKRKVEGKCIKVGYVVPDSIKILTRSLGIINNTNFDGITMYKVKYSVALVRVFTSKMYC